MGWIILFGILIVVVIVVCILNPEFIGDLIEAIIDGIFDN